MTRTGSDDSYYGDELTDPTAVETVCEIQQRRRDEAEDQGELSESDWLGIFPVGTDLDTASAVIVEGGGTFELVGEPWRVWDPLEQAYSHIEASLTRTAGPEDEAS